MIRFHEVDDPAAQQQAIDCIQVCRELRIFHSPVREAHIYPRAMAVTLSCGCRRYLIRERPTARSNRIFADQCGMFGLWSELLCPMEAATPDRRVSDLRGLGRVEAGG